VEAFDCRSAKLNSLGCCDYSRSLSDASGFDSWFSFSSFGSFFLPVAIPLRSCFHVLRDMDGSPGGCHPPFASPLNLSMTCLFFGATECLARQWGRS
jgi:hypothetical protein